MTMQRIGKQAPFRIAHIGAGEWSRYAHGPVLQRLMQQSLVSLDLICDVQIERARTFRDQFGYRQASDDIHTSLIDLRPDAIVCTVPPTATAELVHSLLPLGIPLLIEKPPGASLQEATSLARAENSTGTFTYVAFNRRTIPSLLRLKQWTLQHPVRFARAEMLRTNRMETEFVVATGIHAFDTVRFLMGEPHSIVTNVLSQRGTDIHDYAVKFSFDNQAVAEISLMRNTGLRRESYFLAAEGATAEATLGSPYSSELSYRGDRQWAGEKIVEEHALTGDHLVDGGFVGEYENFFRLVQNGSPSSCSLQDAARSMQLAEAIQKNYSGVVPPLFQQ